MKKREETILKAEKAIDSFYDDYNSSKEKNIRENKWVFERFWAKRGERDIYIERRRKLADREKTHSTVQFSGRRKLLSYKTYKNQFQREHHGNELQIL
jgi:hypothetical protein